MNGIDLRYLDRSKVTVVDCPEEKALSITKLRLIAYTRVSTDEQAEKDKTSLELQFDRCKDYADKIGAQIVEVVSDDYTGTVLSRPGLDRALRMLYENKADGLLCLRVDRLARNVAVFMTLWTTFTNLGKQLHFSDMGLADIAKLDSLLIALIKASMSQEERSLILERMMGGKLKKLSLGRAIDIMANTPFGYRKVKKFDDHGNILSKELRVIENEAKVVQQVFIWMVYGYEGGEPLSLNQIARELNNRGIALTTSHAQNGWSASLVYRMLKNPFYVGLYIWGRTKRKHDRPDSTAREDRPRDEWHIVELPPEASIIDPDTWNKAQEQLKKNAQMAKRDKKNLYLMTGHFRCGMCGRSMVGIISGGKRYRRYQCASRNKAIVNMKPHAENETMCPYPYRTVLASKVESAIWAWLKWILSDPDSLQDGVRHVKQKSEYELEPKRDYLASTLERIKDNEAIIERTTRRMMGEEDDEVYAMLRAKVQELRSEVKDLEKQKSQLEDDISRLEVTEQQVHDIWLMYDQVRDRLNSDNVSFDNKRFLLHLFKVQAKFYFAKSQDGKMEKWLKVECVLGDGIDGWYNLDLPTSARIDGKTLHVLSVHRDGGEGGATSFIHVEAKINLDSDIGRCNFANSISSMYAERKITT
jgi:site-specific DNA recombinase